MAKAFETSFDRFACIDDTIECASDGFQLVATIKGDSGFYTPWDNDCSHGPVSEWSRRDKGPGELILCEARGLKRFYDFQNACRIALRDGWNCAPYDIAGETKRQRAARAARHDFEVLRGWCNDEWHYCGIVVTASLHGIGLGTASLWGIECNYPGSDNAYLSEVANDLASEAISEAQAMRAALVTQ